MELLEVTVDEADDEGLELPVVGVLSGVAYKSLVALGGI